MTWSYDPTQLNTNTLMQVRLLIEDVKTGDQQLQDEEINWTVSQFSTVYLAAAQCCRLLAARYSRDVDTVQGELRTLYSVRQRAYATRAIEYQNWGMQRGGGGMPYAGGVSIQDKTNQVLNTDRVPPDFNKNQFENLLPVGPVGNQTPTPGAPDSDGFPT